MPFPVSLLDVVLLFTVAHFAASGSIERETLSWHHSGVGGEKAVSKIPLEALSEREIVENSPATSTSRSLESDHVQHPAVPVIKKKPAPSPTLIKSEHHGVRRDLQGSSGTCPGTCYGRTCDWWGAQPQQYTCAALTDNYNCDCTGCSCVHDVSASPPPAGRVPCLTSSDCAAPAFCHGTFNASCETITYTQLPNTECGAFRPADTSLTTLSLAESACSADHACSGVRDLCPRPARLNPISPFLTAFPAL